MTGAGARRDLALALPGENADLRGFPRRTFRAGSTWFRQHAERSTADRGAWYFSSSPAAELAGGRFDLPAPSGTCYLASSEIGAMHELVGPDCADRGWVDADLLAGHVISRLELPMDVRAADTTSPRAMQFQVTNELATTPRHDICRAWARAMDGAGLQALLAALRFTPGRSRSLALFGRAGAPAPSWNGDASPRTVRSVAEEVGVSVVDPPTFDQVTIVTPTASLPRSRRPTQT